MSLESSPDGTCEQHHRGPRRWPWACFVVDVATEGVVAVALEAKHAEIFTTTDYGLTQLWASAFRLAGCGGIRYRARHDLAHIAACLTLFGPAEVSKSLAGFEVDDNDHLTARQELIDRIERETEVTVLAVPPV